MKRGNKFYEIDWSLLEDIDLSKKPKQQMFGKDHDCRMHLATKVSENGISQYCTVCGHVGTKGLIEQTKDNCDGD